MARRPGNRRRHARAATLPRTPELARARPLRELALPFGVLALAFLAFSNLVLHSLNALLVHFVSLRLFGWWRPQSSAPTGRARRLAAAFAALLWAVHPLRVEPVVWASERRDVLSAFFLLAEGRIDEAIEHFRAALALRPDQDDAWYNPGNTLHQAGRWQEALEAWSRAAVGMSERHQAYINVGNTRLYRLHDVDGAIDAYRRAVAHVEAHRDRMFTPRPYLYLGRALRQRRDLSAARQALEEAARHPQTREHVVRELAALGRR